MKKDEELASERIGRFLGDDWLREVVNCVLSRSDSNDLRIGLESKVLSRCALCKIKGMGLENDRVRLVSLGVDSLYIVCVINFFLGLYCGISFFSFILFILYFSIRSLKFFPGPITLS